MAFKMRGYSAGEGTGSAKTMAKQGVVTKDNPDTNFDESLTPDEKGEDYVTKKRANQSKKSGDAYDAFLAKIEAFKKSGKTLSKEQIAKLKSVENEKRNNANTDIDAQNFTNDSIQGVNNKYNKAVVINNKKVKDKQTGDDDFDDLIGSSSNKQVGPRNKKGDFVQIQNNNAAGPGPEIKTTVSGKLPEGVYIGKDGNLKNKDGYNYNLKGGNKKNFVPRPK